MFLEIPLSCCGFEKKGDPENNQGYQWSEKEFDYFFLGVPLAGPSAFLASPLTSISVAFIWY